ncbi:nucleotidyltransferase family protein [Algoriphagus sp. A40]|uniref:nucleotidyltransferase family protein n=1 Tax=Algoriphagus sp. A40 TaxID=1945863 RepID=UPI000984B9EE|nr:nucleotidyltransferase domain-containing protein [Algoriphagus sp. A40]OOG77628.1 nucleotidyltransferase [Algoriphagus sp. A40]
MKLASKQLSKIKKYFETKPVLKAYLFGSYVREMANAESDIDILVELDYSKVIGLGFIRMQMDLENLLQKKVDLISANALSAHFKPIIDQEKQLIYER